MHVRKNKCISPKIMPIQTNSYDCGIFIIKVSKCCKSFGAINELIFGIHFLWTYYNFFIVVMSS